MRPYIAAFIYASLAAGVMLLVAALEALDRIHRGYRIPDNFLLEAVASVGFYFILVFVLVAKFPTCPTKVLLALRSTFSLSSLRTPVQRASLLVMCAGAAVIAITSGIYYLNGHDELIQYWFGSRRWASSWYRSWLWIGTTASVVGLGGSFFHDAAVKPLQRWVRGKGPGEHSE